MTRLGSVAHGRIADSRPTVWEAWVLRRSDPCRDGASNAVSGAPGREAALMNLSRGIHAILRIGIVGDARRALDHASDERNIRALARHLGCSKDEARRLYVAARQDGYGA